MTIRALLGGMEIIAAAPAGILDSEIAGVAYHSKQAGPGFLFFAFAGAKADGRRFADDAVARGAVAVVYEQPLAQPPPHAYIVVAHGRRALARVSRNFFGKPDEVVAVTAFTGTNGKSTGTMVTDGVLRHTGRTTSLINTIGYHMCGAPRPAVNTTPESLDVYRMLAETRQAGGSYLTMEISSHALALGRVEDLRVAVAVFTNLTRDHLDFHGTMEDYFAAKASLFGEDFRPGAAVLNADDEWT